MSDAKTLGQTFWQELNMEAPASRKCLERIPEKLFDYKPHEKSMAMGYLALLVAEIPKWLTAAAVEGEVNFATWKHAEAKTTADLVKHFDENLKAAQQALEGVSDETLNQPFYLKNKDQVIMNTPRAEMIGSSINHLVHHRGQLTVYMRLNNLPVPQIYGPSADEKGF